MATVINSFAITGVDGYLVEVEVDLIYGQPSVIADGEAPLHLVKGV